MRIHTFGRFATSSVLVLILAGCRSGSVVPQTPQNAAAPAAGQFSGAGKTIGAWHRSVTQIPLPAEGCYKASFPSTTWSRIACAKPPNRRLSEAPEGGILPDDVGDIHDFTAEVGPNVIATSIGSFPAATGVENVRSVPNPQFGGKAQGPNSYSLQLNSNLFKTAACGELKHCLGWEQFGYLNSEKPFKGVLFVEYWLLPQDGKLFKHCPSSYHWLFGGGYCDANSKQAIWLPNQPIADLTNLSMTASADLSGDSVYLSTSRDMYGIKIHGGAITDLAKSWTGAEFNVFGNGDGTVAKFNAGSTISVSVETDTGVRTAPRCPNNTGTTGESNSLSLVRAPAHPSNLKSPSILFTESNVQSASASCDKLEGSGR
jgi:hypothetical protein